VNEQALAVQINGKYIAQLRELTISKSFKFLHDLNLSETEMALVKSIIKEIRDRLYFLQNVGYNYLTLARSACTFSGGEAQRIRFATQIGPNLSAVLYIRDEPSIGHHQRDNNRFIASLGKMRDLGNTLIVVEHDKDMMRAADYLIDIGPGAGEAGGEVIAAGTPTDVEKNPNSLRNQEYNFLPAKVFESSFEPGDLRDDFRRPIAIQRKCLRGRT
jgi:excinuclease ABC subunit A